MKMLPSTSTSIKLKRELDNVATVQEINSKTISRSSFHDQGFEITETDIDLLDDLFQAISATKSKKKSSRSDEIFLRSKKSLQRFSDYHKHRELSFGFLHKNYIAGLIQLLRDCILCHRWQDALKIVETIAKEGDKVAVISWKVGMASLILERQSHPLELCVRLDKSFMLFHSFESRYLCRLPSLSSCEVLFDYLLCLITVGELERAKDLQKDFGELEERRQTTRMDYLKIIFQSYIGLIYYLLWKAEIAEKDTDDIETALDFISSQLSQGSVHQTSDAKAENAVYNMSYIRGVPGVWDIFIVKVVEIHEFKDDLENARSWLKDYKQQNQDNLNAHRYCYRFEMRHNGENDVKLESLKNIIRLDPSNPLAFDLYKHLEPSDPEAISVLFDYLDFDHCKNDLQAWTLLKKHLTDEYRTSVSYQAVEKCWMTRRDWWPSTCLRVDDNSTEEQLMEIKMEVFKHLEKHSISSGVS